MGPKSDLKIDKTLILTSTLYENSPGHWPNGVLDLEPSGRCSNVSKRIEKVSKRVQKDVEK